MIVALLALLASSAQAAEFSSELSLNRLRVSQLSLYAPDEGSSVFTVAGAWAPAYYVSHRWGLVGTAGVTALKAGDGSAFPATELTLAAQYAFSAAALLELGGGLQTWMNDVGNLGLATARLVSPLRVSELDLPIQLIVGYSSLFVPDHLTHQLQIGVGFQL